jgi:2-oxoglutarate dehydrogenase complex dehydrogenase (E1) component-like enzyme
MIDHFRRFGHYEADLDPLENKKVKEYFLRHTEMEEVYKNLKAEEMEKEVEIDG